ncbi:translation factor Sua5, partial [Staphylococcus simulans]
MKTHIWDLRQYERNLTTYDGIEDIKSIFEKGGLIAIPTETVYGLGG